MGVDHLIGIAGMGGVAFPDLCAVVVAKAGGNGTFAMDDASSVALTGRVTTVMALTDRPFSVNFISRLIENDSPLLDAALEAGDASVTVLFGDPGMFVVRLHLAGALLRS